MSQKGKRNVWDGTKGLYILRYLVSMHKEREGLQMVKCKSLSCLRQCHRSLEKTHRREIDTVCVALFPAWHPAG